MTGIFLFLILPFVVLVVVCICVALFSGSSKDNNDRRGGMGNNFIDWMM